MGCDFYYFCEDMIYECALGSEIGALKELMVVVVYSVSINCAVACYIGRAEVTVYSILVGYFAFGGKCCERVGLFFFIIIIITVIAELYTLAQLKKLNQH